VLLAYLGSLGPDMMLLGLVLPMTVASSLGAYLFYAQHNFPGAVWSEDPEWSYVKAARYSSACIRTNPVMNWLTGSIGYHHIHHLNARIPFYRLTEAMAALEEMQSPGTTSLGPGDIWSCLRLNLWSPEAQRFVSYREGQMHAEGLGVRASEAAASMDGGVDI